MKKTQNIPFFVKGIFVIITLFFSFGIYLSIPVLFNYKSIENIIEDKFYSDFNINLNINGDIKYQLLPKPHLLINESSISIINNNDIMSLDVNDLRIFLNSNSLYPKSKINFEKFEIHKTNFLLKEKEYKILRNYFHTSQTKPFSIFKGKVFVLDQNDEALLISPIEKITFNTSRKDNLKKLNIKGNLFDLNFKSLWKKKFNSDMIINWDDFKKPNIFIKNKLTYENDSSFQGSILIKYFNQNIELDYILKNNLIFVKSPENNNDIKIDTSIELRPIYLSSNIFLNRQNLNFLIDEFLYSIINLNSDLLGNLNGDLKLSFTNIEHELIRNGQINFNINQKTINLDKVLFKLGKIGVIESEFNYKINEENGDLIFNSSNFLLINNKKEFARKFQMKPNKILKLKKIYFKIEKNIDTGLTSIFDIKIGETNNKSNSGFKYKINNSQELKSLVKKLLNN